MTSRIATSMFLCIVALAVTAAAQEKKPNIVIIWGDDIGQSNVSAYSMGLMGYHTPNIDSIAKAGMIFTDYYAEQSCTAGRASFITGQHGLRTGLTKVGLPGATLGLQKEDPTIATLLKTLGYSTAQIGKNHLGDISATATTSCRPYTASTSSTATCITSTPKRNRSCPTIRRPLNSGPGMDRAASSIAKPRIATTPPSIRASAASASRRLLTQAH